MPQWELQPSEQCPHDIVSSQVADAVPVQVHLSQTRVLFQHVGQHDLIQPTVSSQAVEKFLLSSQIDAAGLRQP